MVSVRTISPGLSAARVLMTDVTRVDIFYRSPSSVLMIFLALLSLCCPDWVTSSILSSCSLILSLFYPV
jgi:hypothetical protein